jgi:hypothetical protein
VRNIEDADVVSHGLMFFDDARVLHRHEPATERNNFRASPHMLMVQRRGFLRDFTHANILVVNQTNVKIRAIEVKPPYLENETPDLYRAATQ